MASVSRDCDFRWSDDCVLLYAWVNVSEVGRWLFFFKQRTAYEVRISDWSSDVCSSDLRVSKISVPPPRAASDCTTAWAPSVRSPEKPVAQPIKLGRASCRERVCQYV